MSKEIAQSPKILVSCAAYGGLICDRFEMAMGQTILWAMRNGIEIDRHRIGNESDFSRARNMIIANALANQHRITHLLIVDADMGWEPWRLGRLLSWDKDMVGMPGPTKWIHWEDTPEAIRLGRDPQSYSLRYAVNTLDNEVKAEQGFAKVRDMGCCFFLVKIGALVKMAQSYPQLKCHTMGWANGKEFPGEHTYTFFSHRTASDGRYLEGDHAFMDLWRQLGGDVWADMTAKIDHVGQYNFAGDMGQRYFGRPMGSVKFHAIPTAIGQSWKEHEPEPPEPKEDRFHICTIRPPNNNFPLCFLEMAKLVQAALRELGYECTRSDNRMDEDATNVMFGFHEWWADDQPLSIFDRYRVILYQGEQIVPGGRQFPDWYYIGLNVAHAVWDYSEDNLEILKANGVEAKHVPPAYHPSQECIDYDGTPKDWDIIFVGALNPRRKFICDTLAEGFRTKHLFDVWGSVRDEHLASSKLVLNVHYYAAQTMERLRISHLLANRIPVVSEESDINPYGDGIRTAHYRKLWVECMNLLHDDEARDKLRQDGYEIYKQTLMTDVLAAALLLQAADIPA